jgi:hypothetical protein
MDGLAMKQSIPEFADTVGDFRDVVSDFLHGVWEISPEDWLDSVEQISADSVC